MNRLTNMQSHRRVAPSIRGGAMVGLRIIRILDASDESEWPGGVILEDTDDFVTVDLGEEIAFQNAEGRLLIQKDYRVDGIVWQVHKTDADPFPSRPHAHCVSGPSRYVGTKLHLGSRELFAGAKSLGLFLPKKPFDRLIKLIQPKFPTIKLPLPV
ncbi:hypothetical protein HJB84_02640 [Rhizobium sp. NZLR1b]|uniref:hypothetical protein n=1 Tax=Rhizobium sp. NZLR1b TaxID=2731099 RepID=UPI001C82DFC2|nr:hypothetical protein [Rhizobium sp. NZLR1b]MBX5168763.1 hypothetical protein [Rhizobium sp. NZLR1b]